MTILPGFSFPLMASRTARVCTRFGSLAINPLRLTNQALQTLPHPHLLQAPRQLPHLPFLHLDTRRQSFVKRTISSEAISSKTTSQTLLSFLYHRLSASTHKPSFNPPRKTFSQPPNPPARRNSSSTSRPTVAALFSSATTYTSSSSPRKSTTQPPTASAPSKAPTSLAKRLLTSQKVYRAYMLPKSKTRRCTN